MSSNSDESAARGLSAEELRHRLEEHYDPCMEEDGQWYRCQRDTDNGTSCNRKAFFPTGVLAHENHHSILSGDGPLVRSDHGQSTSGESTKEQGKPSKSKPSKVSPDTGEIMKDIYDDFDDL